MPVQCKNTEEDDKRDGEAVKQNDVKDECNMLSFLPFIKFPIRDPRSEPRFRSWPSNRASSLASSSLTIKKDKNRSTHRFSFLVWAFSGVFFSCCFCAFIRLCVCAYVRHLIVLVLLARVVLVVQLLILADLALAGSFAVNVLEDDAKHIRVPADGAALNAFLDVLFSFVSMTVFN